MCLYFKLANDRVKILNYRKHYWRELKRWQDSIRSAGSYKKPKDICTDRVIGTRKGIGFLNENRLTKNNKRDFG